MTMTRNQKVGTAIASVVALTAMPEEGLLRRLFPAFSVADQVNERIGHAGNDGKCVRRYALVHQFADVYNLLASDLVRLLVFSVQINKSCFPSMLCISGDADPLKVIGPVVCLDSVNVVNAQPMRVAIDKSDGDKPMHKESRSHPINPKSYLLVSSVMRLRSYLNGFSLSSNGLRLSVTNSRVAVRSGGNPNSSFAAYFKRDSALRNSFPDFHDRILAVLGVRIIGGAY